MTNLAKIQFDGASCGCHGPYTFFRSFSYRKSFDQEMRSIVIGQFFFVRILDELPICIAELQLLWESKRALGTKLASVKLYFTPEGTPSGRQSHHGQDELLMADEKVVLELGDLVKWLVEGQVSWPFGYQIAAKCPESIARDDQNMTDGEIGCKYSEETRVVIVSFSQYCRCRAVAKRMENGGSFWKQNVVVQAIGGISVSGNDVRLMFCRDTFEHPILTFHNFRRDRLAPKLKGRKRRKKFSRQDSMESVDSDPGVEALVPTPPEEGAVMKFKLQQRCTKFGATLPSAGLELISSGKEAFEQHLYRFMRERRTPIKRIPSLGFKEVDLFQFFIYSQKYGGYDKVTEGRHWKQIYDQMGGHPGNTSAATCTRRIYEKLLLTFERNIKGEEDKPMPVTYMRPARKKLRELAVLQELKNKPVAHVLPSISCATMSSDSLSPHCNTSPENKTLQTEPSSGAKSSPDLLSDVSELVSRKRVIGQSGLTLTCGQLEVSHEQAAQLKCKQKGSSSLAEDPKSQETKNNSPSEEVSEVPAILTPSTPVFDTTSSFKSSNTSSKFSQKAVANPVACTEAVLCANESNLVTVLPQIVLSPSVVVTTSFPAYHPGPVTLTTTTSQSWTNVENTGGKGGTGNIVFGGDTSATVAGGLLPVAAVGTASHCQHLLVEPKLTHKDSTLMPLEFLSPNAKLSSSLPRSGFALVRPTYGPPNLLEPLARPANGHFSSTIDPKSSNCLKPQSIISGSSFEVLPEISKTSTLFCEEASEKRTPQKADVPRTTLCSGSWFNSPIKQFLDRTQAMSSALRSHDVDDQPVDLSTKSQNSLSKPQDHLSFLNCFQGEQEEPLNLSKKQDLRDTANCGVKVKALGNDLVVPAKKPAISSGEARKVVLPKSDQFVPLILSVPSLTNVTSQPVVVSNIPSLSLTSLPNTSLVKNGLAAMPTVLSSAPFPVSLVGAALRPVLQFFPPHPLATNIAYTSEAGHPLLLRFPLPVPVSAPISVSQASLLAPKTNRS